MWSTKATWVATFHDDYQRVESSPPYPSVGLPRETSTGIRGCPPHYPSVHSLSTVGCHTTQRPLKLLSFWDPINHVCASTKSMLYQHGPTDAVLNWHRQLLPPSKLQTWKQTTHQPSHPLFSTSPSCPAQSHIKSTTIYSNSQLNPWEPIGDKKP
jgi:hypothetical protein